MRHDQDRDALCVQLLKERHHFYRRATVEISRRLVGEQKARLGDECARDRHPLLLSTRQLARLVVQPIREADALQCSLRELPRVLLLARTVVQQRQLDVIERRRPREQVESLKDETELLVPYIRELVLAQALYANSIEGIGALGRDVETAEDIH